MIIVKTKNGSVLINDRETHAVEHLKDKAMVVVRSDKNKLNANILDVESMTYTSDAQPTQWEEKGLEVEQLMSELENAKNENHYIYEHAQFMRQWFFIYQNAFEAIKRARKDEIEGKPIYRNIDSIIEQAESEYAESQKKWEQVCKKWEDEK